MTRAGIVGYGLAGEVFHAPLAAAAGIEVARIVTSSAERAARARAAYPAAQVVGTVDEVWDGIDLLVVAAPNQAHVPLALAAAERGLPVVVDKPLAPSAAEAGKLLAAGGRVTVFQNRRLDGDFLTARSLVSTRQLGLVVRFESRFERFRPAVDPAAWREHGDPAAGGGLLLDLGSHLVDQAVELLGPPVRVYAEVQSRRPGARVDDDVFVALEHAGGARSHLWMSAAAPLHGPRMRLSGLEAGFACDGLDPQEDQLAAGLRPGDPGWGEREPGVFVDHAGARPQPLAPGRWEHFYAGVRSWLEEGAPPPVDPADALAVLQILDAARRSAATSSVIDLEGTPS